MTKRHSILAINVNEQTAREVVIKTKNEMKLYHKHFKITGGPHYGESKVETFCVARHGERPRMGRGYGGCREVRREKEAQFTISVDAPCIGLPNILYKRYVFHK